MKLVNAAISNDVYDTYEVMQTKTILDFTTFVWQELRNARYSLTQQTQNPSKTVTP